MCQADEHLLSFDVYSMKVRETTPNTKVDEKEKGSYIARENEIMLLF